MSTRETCNRVVDWNPRQVVLCVFLLRFGSPATTRQIMWEHLELLEACKGRSMEMSRRCDLNFLKCMSELATTSKGLDKHGSSKPASSEIVSTALSAIQC